MHAVDGNTSGIWPDYSISSTESETNAWWQVDLGASYSLGNVILWNRTDCCTDRLSDVYILVSANDMTGRSLVTLLGDPSVSAYRINGEAPPAFNIPTPTTGRYVRVMLAGANYLSLAEVQVLKN